MDKIQKRERPPSQLNFAGHNFFLIWKLWIPRVPPPLYSKKKKDAFPIRLLQTSPIEFSTLQWHHSTCLMPCQRQSTVHSQCKQFTVYTRECTIGPKIDPRATLFPCRCTASLRLHLIDLIAVHCSSPRPPVPP